MVEPNEHTAQDHLLVLIARLLALADESEKASVKARAASQRTESQRQAGAARAYVHAARLAGWRAE